jgi:hypothetical protein
MQSELSTFARDDSYEKTVRDEDTNIQRNVIRHILLGHPEGITDMEICILTGISRTSVCARRNEIHGVTAVGLAKIINWDGGEDRLNTLWSVIKYE